jgi:hypothetical protein
MTSNKQIFALEWGCRLAGNSGKTLIFTQINVVVVVVVVFYPIPCQSATNNPSTKIYLFEVV